MSDASKTICANFHVRQWLVIRVGWREKLLCYTDNCPAFWEDSIRKIRSIGKILYKKKWYTIIARWDYISKKLKLSSKEKVETLISNAYVHVHTHTMLCMGWTGVNWRNSFRCWNRRWAFNSYYCKWEKNTPTMINWTRKCKPTKKINKIKIK